MTIEIVSIDKEGDKSLLNTKCKEVKKEEINEELRRYINSMWDLMYETKGVGLAAPQTRFAGEKNNVQKRLTVIDTHWKLDNETIKKGQDRLVLINPEIISKSKEMSFWEVDGGQIRGEGCLSVPEKKYKVKRYNEITISYLDKLGKKRKLTVNKDEDTLLTICIQHELDHLNGVLICDIGEEMSEEEVKAISSSASKKKEEEALT